MKKLITIAAVLALGLLVSLGATVRASGNGDISIQLNGGDNVAYVGDTNIVEIWIENDEEIITMCFAFEFSIGRNFQFDPVYGGSGHYVREEGDAVGAFDDFTGLLENQTAMDDTNPDSILIGGVGMLSGLPANGQRLCYTMAVYIPPGQAGLVNGFCIDNIFFPPAGSFEFQELGGFVYSPTFQGNSNSSVDNPDAPPVYFDIVGPMDSAIVLDTVLGLNASGQIIAEQDFDFVMRWTYTTGNPIVGFSNGFKVYSPDGATWQPIVADTFNLGWTNMFDLVFNINYFSADGSGADTVGLGGASMMSSLTPPFDNQAWYIRSRASTADVGKHLCVDSAYFPPSGPWLWSTQSTGNFVPGWSGPHCYEIGPPAAGSIDSAIILDTVLGLNASGQIIAEQDFDFVMRWTYTTGNPIVGFTNGFKVYSPDGATWQPIVADTFNLGWTNMFDLVFNINYFSADGSGADTVGLGGASMMNSLMPPFDNQAWYITSRVSEADTGLHLCVDSAWFPPSGPWLWSTQSTGNFVPGWSGPHCYEIGPSGAGPVRDTVLCEPQGSGNPTHPGTYWYDVTPGDFGRCDFHVKIVDSIEANYSNWSQPIGWVHQVHKVGSDWWVSWWDPGCANAIFDSTRFSFDHDGSAVWSDWRTTIDGSNDPYAQIIDSAENHSSEPDGYGYRVHVPEPLPIIYLDTVICEPQGGGNPTHPETYWYDVSPASYGRCDFHVRVNDDMHSHYSNWQEPINWTHRLHEVNGEWWVSWYNPGCADAIFDSTRFGFDNSSPSTWGHWTTTIDGTDDPFAQVFDSSGNHSSEVDGYGYRVHVPTFTEGPHPDSSITLDDVIGLYKGPGRILADDTVKFYMRLTNVAGNAIGGMQHGFRVYSPDGANWQPITIDTVSIGWYPDRFDGGFWRNYNSANGSGADTAWVASLAMTLPGLVAPFDGQVWWITTMTYAADAGKHLCLDSSYFPPAGNWLWTDHITNFAPNWDGPHCFEIAVPCIPPLRGNVNYDPLDAVNIADLTYLVAYLFGGGDAPPSFEEGDVNGDDTGPNIQDLTHLVAYLFGGGPAPAPCP